MRKKINKKIVCLFLVVQVLNQIAQADIVNFGTKSTTVDTTKVSSKDGVLKSCSASSSSESSGKY